MQDWNTIAKARNAYSHGRYWPAPLSVGEIVKAVEFVKENVYKAFCEVHNDVVRQENEENGQR
jgi:hypothetical protein